MLNGNPSTVFICDFAIPIQVTVADASQSLTVLFGCIVHIFLCFEDAVRHITIKRIQRMSQDIVFIAVTSIRVLHIGRKFGYFIAVS